MSAVGTDYRADPRGGAAPLAVRASMRLPASVRRHGRLGGRDNAVRARDLLVNADRRKSRGGERTR